MRKINFSKIISALYILLLILANFLFFRGPIPIYSWRYFVSNRINLIPFSSIIFYIKAISDGTVNSTTIYINLLGWLFFVPLGIFLPLWIKKSKTIPLFSLAFIVILEILQVVSMCGSFDVDDIILHFIGVIIGFVITIVTKKLFSKEKNKKLLDK